MIFYHTATTPPAALPFRITLADGSTRTDAACQLAEGRLTPEDIAGAGFTASPDKPEFDAVTHVLEWGGDDWAVREKTAEERLAELPYKTAKEARQAMVGWIDTLTAQVMDEYPLAVQKRWEIEEAAARAVKADTATADQLTLVTREGATKGRTPEEHAHRIILNADRFRAIADQINTLFLSVGGQIENASGPEEYEAILAGAIASAAPLAAAYGLD